MNLNRNTRYWGIALAALIPTGVVLLIVGVTPLMAKAYALAGLVVVAGGWAWLAHDELRRPPQAEQSSPEPRAVRNGQRPPTEELELEEASS